METQTPVETSKEVESGGDSGQWNPVTRIAFRFCVVYFGLYYLGIPWSFGPALGPFADDFAPTDLEWATGIVNWMGPHVFGVETAPYRFISGDSSYEWVRLGSFLIAALAVTAVWSVLDRHRPSYHRVYPWFRLFLRIGLAGQMFLYGMAKVFPMQMWLPLDRLVQPLGDLSPGGIMWAQVGTSPTYEVLLGCAEVTGGLLLLLPRTVLPGALLCAVSMGQVFLMDMSYDVPVKLHSFHLLLMALVLLAPDIPRLVGFFTGHATGPLPQRPLVSSRRGAIIASVATMAAGLWMLIPQANTSATAWRQLSDAPNTVPLYGIWNVAEFAQDGVPRPPLVTDTERWRHIVFDLPGVATIQRMDNTREVYAATVDESTRAVTLMLPGAPNRTVQLHFEQPDADQLNFDGQGLEIRLTRIDPESFPLKGGGFKWVHNDGIHPLFPIPGTR